jgi:hypothetical protein
MFKGTAQVSFIKMWNAVYYNYGLIYLTQLNGETYKVLASSKEGRENNGYKN